MNRLNGYIPVKCIQSAIFGFRLLSKINYRDIIKIIITQIKGNEKNAESVYCDMTGVYILIIK